jgi:hypothetical protein
MEDDDDDDVGSVQRINLVGLMRNTPGAFSAAAQNSGEVGSADQKMERLSVAGEQLQRLSVQHQQARSQAQKMMQQKYLATRRRVLMNTLGMQKFYKMLSLVKELKVVREKLLRSCASSESSSQQQQQQQRATTAPGKIRVCKRKFEALHKTARDLLQSTDLVMSVERTEMDRLAKLPWNELIHQAQQNIYAYREYLSISETRE